MRKVSFASLAYENKKKDASLEVSAGDGSDNPVEGITVNHQAILSESGQWAVVDAVGDNVADILYVAMVWTV